MEGWVIQLLLLALLSWIVTESSLFFADILECDGTRKGFNYKVNTQSTVCCILEEEECKKTTENDQLYFELKPETEEVPEPSWYNLSLGPCRTQLTVNSTAAGTMVVSCYKNKYKLARENMQFIDKPAKPVISDIKYYENKSVEIYFQVKKSSLFAESDEFNVSLARQEHQSEKTYNVCSTHCEEASSANNFTCKCTIKLKTFLTQDIRIIINVTRVMESNSVIKFYKLSRHVVPGKIRWMKVTNNAKTCAVLRFKLSWNLRTLMEYMNQTGKPLNYSVVLVNNNGTDNKLTFVTQAGKNPDQLDQASDYVELEHLEPFTNYTVTVIGIGGGGEGAATSLNFITKKSVVTGAVQELSATITRATSATISWRMSHYLAGLMKFMEKNPLEYRMTVSKTDGVPEPWNVTAKKINLESRYVYVELVNLTSYTGYTVTVFGIACRGQCERQEIGFMTNKSVPSSSPNIEKFRYSPIISPNESLLIMWDPLPRDAMGGSNISYQVEVTVGQANSTTHSVKKPHFVQKLTSLSEQITFKVWSVNELGRSDNYSELVLPKPINLDFLKDVSLVGPVENDQVMVNINLEDIKHKQIIAVHWCEEEKDQIFFQYNVCKDQIFTHKEKFNENQVKGGSLYSVTVNLRTNRQEQPDSRTFHLIKHYECKCWKCDNLPESVTNATINTAVSVMHMNGKSIGIQTNKWKFFYSAVAAADWSGIIQEKEEKTTVKPDMPSDIVTVVIASVVPSTIIVFIIIIFIFMKKFVKRKRYFAPLFLSPQMEPIIQKAPSEFHENGVVHSPDAGVDARLAEWNVIRKTTVTSKNVIRIPAASMSDKTSVTSALDSTSGVTISTTYSQYSTTTRTTTTSLQSDSRAGYFEGSCGSDAVQTRLLAALGLTHVPVGTSGNYDTTQ
ncbi:uncharacterized protein LOC131954265 [Physella acuta]|uniref:uncharacterized protein LOC131954265 n=1 Tax=Physella acuta TaxID=109671 RepID=UPI0027DE7DE6|nr:uncharacterized protein LOC131954265 [Physella acuta]